MIIDHERADDYAAAIANNREAALAWLNTALKQMEHQVAVNGGGDAAKIEQYKMRNGSRLIVLVTFSPPKETA